MLELRSFVPQLAQEAGLANAGLTSPLSIAGPWRSVSLPLTPV